MMLFKTIKRIAIIALALTFVFAVPVIASAEVRGHLADVAFVKDKVGNANWVILDVRSPADYKKGHIPGAVNMGIATHKQKAALDIFRDSTARFLPVKKLENLFGAVGFNYDKGIIVYGKKGDYHGAVIMMVFEYLGLENVYYLDGGWEKWLSKRGKRETRVNKAKAVNFKAKNVDHDMYVTTQEMYDFVQNPGSITILDCRSVAEWEGTKFLSVRAGRIPGAVHIPVYGLIKKDGTLISTSKMKKMYKDIPKDKPVVVYCQRGCRVSFVYLALDLLGYDFGYYDDGWRVWGMKETLPAENEQWIHIKKIFVLEKKMKAVQKELQELKKRGVSGGGAAQQEEDEGC
ncbi:MAG: sulfurtransferase [Desulfobacterales bacterium]|uniref:Sulfurtransferase n=1 Tax=Candidatus Desulfaltia bathyphila TaxID=2841697 RepID=A0A8J6N419_9BACT|nr:sulfurtransferase [Candidatus Desulfaltia bathyphila]MBL7195568.1 sulfurtransferase [Desulfobacterales bacterium]MBL7207065.1 sulfurtransferase [Desulfobacterales bacterium]